VADFPQLPSFQGRRVTVMGLGRFGGGLGAVQFLLNAGAVLTLTDLGDEDSLAESLAQIDVSRLSQLTLGEHREEDFINAEWVVVNPAIPLTGNQFLELAIAHGAQLTTEINLFWERCAGKKIVVTGTVGKSTTASLLHHCLQQVNKNHGRFNAWIGGNIGRSLLPDVSKIAKDDWVILELSSYQLARLAPQAIDPEIAIITNLFPNHLQWHGNFTNYKAAKQIAIANQSPSHFAILNGDDPDLTQWPTAATRIVFGKHNDEHSMYVTPHDSGWHIQTANSKWTLNAEDVAVNLRTPHQRKNVAAVLATTLIAMDLDPETIFNSLQTFQSLPHRLTLVSDKYQRHWINDSKATTPTATQAALNAVETPVVLIAGGKDQQLDLVPLSKSIVAKAHAVCLIGETAPLLAKQIANLNPAIDVSIHQSLKDAVDNAAILSAPGDTILLSPGCASDCSFMNYQQRGDHFAQLVIEMEHRSGPE